MLWTALLLTACTPRGITQAGHTVRLTETRSRRPGYGVGHGVDVVLDDAPLALTHWYTPVSPPVRQAPRTFYWGGGTSPETWEWEVWEVFQVKPSSPEQHAAAKEFLDAGTGPLFDALTDTPAYEWSYARQVFVLWERAHDDLVFTADSGESFSVTDTGAVFMDGARIGSLQSDQGRVTGVEIDLSPHTFGSGPGQVRIEPTVQDPRAYRLPSGHTIYSTYGLTAP